MHFHSQVTKEVGDHYNLMKESVVFRRLFTVSYVYIAMTWHEKTGLIPIHKIHTYSYSTYLLYCLRF